MSTFGYRKELGKYEDVDEDKLLAALSSEELQELERELADLDPDDNVPIGLRQKDQTAKTPTGSFDREALLKYWEDENKKLLEEEKVDSSPGRANTDEGRRDKSRVDRVTASYSDITKPKDNEKKNIFQKGKKVESLFGKNYASSKKDEEEKKDDCKREALPRTKGPQKKVCNSLPTVSRTETTDQNLNLASDRPSGNPIVIDTALEQVLRDDPTMSEVNLNNIEDISQETLLRFAEALCTNTHVHVFSLTNTHADDRVAFAISKMLRENHSIKNLNIESNFVSGQGILALLTSLQHNKTLVELRFHNQRHICGGKVEMEMVHLLRENTTLLKLGYQFDLPGPRMTATSILTRNLDQQRQKRLQQQKEQSHPEASVRPGGQLSGSSVANRPPQKPQSSKTVGNHNKNNTPPPPHPTLDPLPEKNMPTRKIADMVKQHEGSNSTKGQTGQRKPKSKKIKNGANEKESADIVKELKNALKPSLQKRRDEPSQPLAPQRSSRDDLMEAIRGSSIMSLKRVNLSQS